MRSTLVLGLLFATACSSDPFTSPADSGPGDGNATDGPATIEGGNTDGGDDAMAGPKPRMFASVLGTSSTVLAVWNDPDSLAAPRQPDVSIGVPNAFDVVVAKKRVYVAGGTAIHTFDKPLELTSQSTPKSFDKTAFVGVTVADPLNVVALHYEPNLDILSTADDGVSALQIFKSASSSSIPPMATARFGTDSDNMLYPAMSASGQLFGTRNGMVTTLYFDNAPNATGSVTTSNFVFGSTRPYPGAGRLYVPGSGGAGGASIYVYQLPIMMAMQSPLFELHSAFGGAAQSDSAREVALNPNWLASAIWKSGGTSPDSYVCVMSNPGALGANSTCNNTIPVTGRILRLFERKGSLYVSSTTNSGTPSGSITIYRNPMTDTKPTVTLDLGMNTLATGIAFAE